MKKRIRLQGFLIFLAVVTTILFSKFIFSKWQNEALDITLDTVGVAMVLLGFLFRIAARGAKSEASCNGHLLIQGGLYNLIRHPMYFGTLLIGIGLVMVIFVWWVLPIFFIIYLSIYLPQIKREEASLYKRFGDEYKSYCRKTPKYFPNLFKFIVKDPKDYFRIKLPWIKKELPSLLWILAAIIVIEIWEDVRLYGTVKFGKELSALLLVILPFIIIAVLCYEK